jgi:hypothetical protein
VNFEVLAIDKYRYGKNIFPRDVKFCPRTGNPPRAYQHLSLAGSRTGRNRRAGQKTFVYIRVANFADFSPKIANLGFLLKRVLGNF